MKRLKKVSVHLVAHIEKIPQSNFEKGVFFETCGPIFSVAQVFGAMPVVGLMANDPLKLRFTWKSFRFWYSILLIVSQIWFFSCVAAPKTSFTINRISK